MNLIISSNSAAPGRQDLAKYNTRPTVFVKAQTHGRIITITNALQYCVPSKRVAAAVAIFSTHTRKRIL